MKKQIREEILKKRRGMKKLEVVKNSSVIILRLRQLREYSEAKNVMFYSSIKNEVETHELIREALTKRNVFLPKINRENLHVVRIKRYDDLAKGKYGILESRKGEELGDLRQLDVVIVPGIAFDMSGNRIGFGIGYYDRLLKKTSAVKIALAHDFQVVDKIPAEAHDVPVDVIITEKRIINNLHDHEERF